MSTARGQREKHPVMLTVAQAAKRLGLSRGAVYDLINQGYLDHYPYPGHGIHVTDAECDRFLEAIKIARTS